MNRNDGRAQFFISDKDIPRLLCVISEKFPRSLTRAKESADRICDHKFDLLGSGEKALGAEIDWQLDFKSGYRWSGDTPSAKIKYGHKRGADIKVPWELSRFQHLVTLGKAYWYSKKRIEQRAESKESAVVNAQKYLREFVGEIEDWIQSNTVGYGVNWVCPMEAAIRAVNWIWAYHFFRGGEEIPESFWKKFIRSLRRHGEYVYGNLESEFPRTNHYLADLVGLFFIAHFLPDYEGSKEWLAFSYYELIGEMKTQVSEEGVDYEGSTHYHCLVTELFLAAYILGMKNGIDFPPDFKRKLEMMLEFVMTVTKPNGLIPQIGDNDSGRLWFLGENGYSRRLDWRYLLNLGAVIFQRKDFKARSGDLGEENLWILGEEGLDGFEGIPVNTSNLESRDFPASGYYLLRAGTLRLLVDCLPEDRSAPHGHRHNSRLSFELSSKDEDLIVDPGSYAYTADPEWRNRFRGTAYHSTVLLDEKEQNRFYRRQPFEFREQSKTRLLRRESTADYDILELELQWAHPGYFYQRRRYRLAKREDILLIEDRISAPGKHRFRAFFHFAPGIELSLPKEGEAAGISRSGAAVYFKLVSPARGARMLTQKSWFSPAYGEKIESRTLRLSSDFRDRVDFTYLIIFGKRKEEIQKKLAQVDFTTA